MSRFNEAEAGRQGHVSNVNGATPNVAASSGANGGLSRLTQIAAEANATFLHCEAASRLVVREALRVGRLLNEAQDLLAHGEFGQWRTQNCPNIPERTAQR